jgi:hypothetical protein
MFYVIKRSKDGKMVSIPGSKKSYTTNIQKAQKFNTYQEAKDNACGNEYPAQLLINK